MLCLPGCLYRCRNVANQISHSIMQYLRRRANLAWSNAGLPSYSYVFDVVTNGVPGKQTSSSSSSCPSSFPSSFPYAHASARLRTHIRIAGYIGATHFQEVAFVFDNTNGEGYTTNPFGNQPAAYPALAKSMSNAWVNFITGLDPNGATGLGIEGVDAWPVYNTTDGGGVGKVVMFDTNGSSLVLDSYRAEGINWMIENSLAVFGN